MNDRANDEIKGIARYIPTHLSKAILLLLPGAAWFTFSSVQEHPDWFGLASLSPLEKTLTALLAASGLCIILVIALVLDMSIAIHHSKHRRIIHYSNQHPLMSFKFLIANASILHWLVTGLICFMFFITGYIFQGI